jgi:hypothetical protein
MTEIGNPLIINEILVLWSDYLHQMNLGTVESVSGFFLINRRGAKNAEHDCGYSLRFFATVRLEISRNTSRTKISQSRRG